MSNQDSQDELRAELWKVFDATPENNDGRGTINHFFDVLVPFINAHTQKAVRTAQLKAAGDIAILKQRETLHQAELEKVSRNALVIAEYWLQEDGRPKHLIQDLQDVKDISVLDHIGEEYVNRYSTQTKDQGTK